MWSPRAFLSAPGVVMLMSRADVLVMLTPGTSRIRSVTF